METLLTVLITLMVVALTGAGINLVRLNRKADELDTLKLDMIDINDSINRTLEQLEREQNDRIEKWVASTDRRFDYMRNDLDKIINKKK